MSNVIDELEIAAKEIDRITGSHEARVFHETLANLKLSDEATEIVRAVIDDPKNQDLGSFIWASQISNTLEATALRARKKNS